MLATFHKLLALKPGVSGIHVPLKFVASLLWLRSTLCCRFAPVAPLSFLASPSIAQPTDNPVEKLCSALNFCWLQQKRPFSNGKNTLLVTASPGGSLPFCFSRPSPCRAETCLFASLCSLCHSFNPCQCRRLRFAGGPPSKLLPLKL